MLRFLILFFTLLLSVACNSDREEKISDHGPDPLAYTLYSDKMEFFVEFPALVVGNTAKFAAHFTVLGEKFTALTAGKVTVSLEVNGKAIRQQQDTAASPGIFRLALKPVQAGTGKLIFDIVTPQFSDRIIIDSVTVFPDAKAALSAVQQEAGGSDISYLKEQAWKVDFANAPVMKKPFHSVIRTNGELVSAPGDEIMVTARAGGIVIFDGSKIAAGTAVSKGTGLFTIAGGGYAENTVNAKFSEVKSEYERAMADYNRAAELVADKIVSQRDFLRAKADFEKARIAYESMGANYTEKGQSAVAGMDGYIRNVFVTEGQYVSAGTPLAVISKNRRLQLRAHVSQRYFDQLPQVRSANFKTSGSEKVYSTELLNGKLVSYGKSAAGNSAFIPVVFELDNNGKLIPGTAVEVFLRSQPLPDVLTVPISALIEEQGVFYVYVQTASESFQKREVRTGANDGLNVQVLSGIQEGERVVTAGAYQIKLAQAGGSMPAHGHEH